MTDQELLLLSDILKQEKLEAVVPKLECWHNPARFKIAYGGRGSGKSMAAASILVQRANRESIKVLCAREIQKSIEESVYALIQATAERLEYTGWRFFKDVIISPTGSRFLFRGLKDLRASQQIKSYEGFDVIWVEEASTVSDESWQIIIPTFRKQNSEIWATFNRETETDPVFNRFCVTPRKKSIICEVNWNDNPWFPDVLKSEMEQDYEINPDEAEHIWGGQPRKQGHNSVMSRSSIRAAMDRNIEAIGCMQVGVDVARFGNDKTEIYIRKGLKIIQHKELVRQDTQQVARVVWDMINRDPSIPICVDDTGLGGGVSDKLKDLGAKVVMINFGGSPNDKNKYTSIADEMWFEFDINEADIPNDPELMQELSGRQYTYDNKNRRKIESKDKFKERIGRSCDKADALLLCYYTGKTIKMSDETRKALADRRKRG